MTTAAINRIDKQLEQLPGDSLRAQVLKALRRFRASWVELGGLLSDVAYSGSYKEWGFDEFELYCARELGLKRPTVKKLMVSYNYMKEREPERLEAFAQAPNDEAVPSIPDYQTVELLHRAQSNPELDDKVKERLHDRAFAGEEEENALRQQIREHLREPSDAEVADANAARRKELNDILRTARALRRKLAHAQHVPGGLRERIEKLLVELEALD